MKRTPLKPDSIRTVPGSVLRGLAAEIERELDEYRLFHPFHMPSTAALLQRILALLKAEEKQ